MPSPDRVPTLTEVVELDTEGPPALTAFATDAALMEADAMVLSPEEVAQPVPAEATPVEALVPAAPEPSLPTAPDEPAAAFSEPPNLAEFVPPAEPAVPAEDLVADVLRELEPRIELMLEARLRDALAPALARAADGFIRDARGEVHAAVRELVEDAVARALRRRAPP